MITFQWLHWITTKDDDDDDPMKKELSFKFGSCSVTISNLKIFFFFLVYHYYCCCCCRQLVFTMIKDQILLVIAIKLTTDQIRIVSFFIFFGYSISIWKLIKFTHYTHTWTTHTISGGGGGGKIRSFFLVDSDHKIRYDEEKKNLIQLYCLPIFFFFFICWWYWFRFGRSMIMI